MRVTSCVQGKTYSTRDVAELLQELERRGIITVGHGKVGTNSVTQVRSSAC